MRALQGFLCESGCVYSLPSGKKKHFFVFQLRGTSFSRFPRGIFVHIKRSDLLKRPIWWYNQIHWRKCPGCNKCKKHRNQRDFGPFLRMQINHLRQVEMKKRMKNIGGSYKSKQTASEQKWNAKCQDFRIKRVTCVIISTAREKNNVQVGDVAERDAQKTAWDAHYGT